MRTTNRALRQARRLVPAVALTSALLAGGTLLTAAPASAESGPLSLTVHAPASIGAAGGPVEFTETIDNQDRTGWGVVLKLSAETSFGSSADFMSLEWQNEVGNWERLPLTYRADGDKAVFDALVTGKIIVPAGEKKDVHLRIGVPMGTAHNGTPNRGMVPTVKLRSEVKGWWQNRPVEPAVQDSRDITVGAVSNGLTGVPARAVAGGEPIEFDAVLRNPTLSAYTGLDSVLITDRTAKVEVRGADGTWSTLTPDVFLDSSTGTFHLGGRDSSAAPGSTRTEHLRVAYTAGTTTDRAHLQPCVTVNEPDDDNGQVRGTYFCSPGADVEITEAPAPAAPAPAAPAVQPVAAVAPAAVAAVKEEKPLIAADGGVTPWSEHPAEVGGSLAATGADTGWDRPAAGVAALLLGGGAGLLALVRRRRAMR